MHWWRDVDPDISQPALDHHYLTMHLGGPKRVERCGEGRVHSVDIESGALSIVPAGSIFEWSTRGPIEFAHIYFAPAIISLLSVEEFDRDVSSLCLEDRLGMRDPLLQALFLTMLEEVEGSTEAARVYLDTLLHSLLLRLLRSYANGPAGPLRIRHSLAPARLRRVLEYIEANLANDIALADIAAVAASSPFHFSRAFAREVGCPPYAYLLRRRIEHAKTRMSDGLTSIDIVAAQCGFRSKAQFSRVFKRVTGVSPAKYWL